MAKNIRQVNLKVSPASYQAKLYFSPDFTITDRINTETSYINKDIYENISINHGFNLFFENGVKVICEQAKIISHPNIQFENSDLQDIFYPLTAIGFDKLYNKTVEIGTFKTRKGFIKGMILPPSDFDPDDQTSINPNLFLKNEGNIVDRTLESLFLEVISNYISSKSLPSWGTINGTNLYLDYQNTYNRPFESYGSHNMYAHLQPTLEKTITINVSYEGFQTHPDYPVSHSYYGRIVDMNPFEEQLSNEQKNKYKI